jgi:hypothetical protein
LEDMSSTPVAPRAQHLRPLLLRTLSIKPPKMQQTMTITKQPMPVPLPSPLSPSSHHHNSNEMSNHYTLRLSLHYTQKYLQPTSPPLTQHLPQRPSPSSEETLSEPSAKHHEVKQTASSWTAWMFHLPCQVHLRRTPQPDYILLHSNLQWTNPSSQFPKIQVLGPYPSFFGIIVSNSERPHSQLRGVRAKLISPFGTQLRKLRPDSTSNVVTHESAS